MTEPRCNSQSIVVVLFLSFNRIVTDKKKKKKIFFELQNSSKEKGRMRELLPNLSPQRTNLEQRPPECPH